MDGWMDEGRSVRWLVGWSVGCEYTVVVFSHNTKSKLAPNYHCRYPMLQDRWHYQTATSSQRCSALCLQSLRETWLESHG